MIRVPAGRILGRTVPGALYGPMWTGEFLVATDDTGSLGFARTEDTDQAAMERIVAAPQTVAEARMAFGVQLGEWERLAGLLGRLEVKP